VPVDCEVFHGGATITIEHLTGEVKPLEAKVGDRVPGGARNIDGRIIVKVCWPFQLLLYYIKFQNFSLC
jgi:Zn2+/Cd2+-exporting ATPase